MKLLLSADYPLTKPTQTETVIVLVCIKESLSV